MSPRFFFPLFAPILLITFATPIAAQTSAGNAPGGTKDPLAGAPNNTSPQAMSWNEFKSALMKRYDQKVVVARVGGLVAGEKDPELFGAGRASMYWHHFHPSMPLPQKVTSGLFFSNKLSDMDQLDDRTYGKLIAGVNTTPIEKNERLKVSKFYVYPNGIEFVLTATGTHHLRDIDERKANSQQYGGTRYFSDFALIFDFYFDKQNVLKAGDFQTVVAEIGKYLLPQDEAEAALAAEKNIELEIGMPEENVIQKMGQPIRSIKVGDQRFLKYKEMTVVIKDGKVADVKVE
jgi:hypothetical protein